MRLLKKIPLLFIALLLVAVSVYYVKTDVFDFLNDDIKVNILSGMFTLIGLVILSIQIQAQWKNDQISTEYLNQPDFKIVGFEKDTVIGESPKLCSLPHDNSNDCHDDHWFDIKQISKLPASNIRIGLFHSKDLNVNIPERWLEINMLYLNDSFQYKLPQNSISIKHFNPLNNDTFKILIEYTSIYSKIKYRRIYDLNYSAINKENTNVMDWKCASKYYGISLKYMKDTNSQTLIELIISYAYRVKYMCNKNKSKTIEQWKRLL